MLSCLDAIRQVEGHPGTGDTEQTGTFSKSPSCGKIVLLCRQGIDEARSFFPDRFGAGWAFERAIRSILPSRRIGLC